MQKDSDYLDLMPQMGPVDEPGVSAGVLMILPPLSLDPSFLAINRHVLSDAKDFMVQKDPAFRVQDHNATIRWVGGRTGAWEIYFTHKVSGERKCVRWVNYGSALGMYSFDEINGNDRLKRTHPDRLRRSHPVLEDSRSGQER